jgi:hypothetical protein
MCDLHWTPDCCTTDQECAGAYVCRDNRCQLPPGSCEHVLDCREQRDSLSRPHRLRGQPVRLP